MINKVFNVHKIFFWILMFSILSFNLSCKDEVDGASSVNTVTTIYIGNYLGLCEAFFEGTKDITVTIDVDILNSSGQVTSNHKNYRYFVENDESDGSNVEFSGITVPESGSFSITVTSSANVCYQCCNGRSCSSTDGGRPRFRGQKVFMNAKGIPTSVNISLKRVSCD